MTEREAFEAFGRWCMDQLRGDLGCDLDGFAAQEKMKELGLLVEFEATEPCDASHCHCAEWDDFPQTCLRPPAASPPARGQ